MLYLLQFSMANKEADRLVKRRALSDNPGLLSRVF